MRTRQTARSSREDGASERNKVSQPDRASIVAQLAALKTRPMAELKAEWRRLMDCEPPPFNRKFLESRLGYRIQELAYGGVRPETKERLKALAEELLDGKPGRKRREEQDRPVVGTRLIREWQGIEHVVTVERQGYAYQGRPYQTLSSVARAITGTNWNGWLFFGLRRTGKAQR